MSWLRRQLDRAAPHFESGRLSAFRPLFEAIDTILYTPGTVTRTASHVRDGADLKRIMMTVVIALVPCVAMALYNTGYQAHLAIERGALPLDSWQTGFMEWLGVSYDAGSFVACVLHGALYFVPVLVVTFAVGGGIEIVSAALRKHEVNEGFLVTGMLFPLILPPGIPLWQVALGIGFGVIFGKEVFGGTGMNFLNPALLSRAFLFFAYPADLSGNVWTAALPAPADTETASVGTAAAVGAVPDAPAVTAPKPAVDVGPAADVDTAATPAADAGMAADVDTAATPAADAGPVVDHPVDVPATLPRVEVPEVDVVSGGTGAAWGTGDVDVITGATALTRGGSGADPLEAVDFWDAFLGLVPGSMGETSTLACLLGAALLLVTRIASWRIMLGVALGTLSAALLLDFTGSAENPLLHVPFHWHVVLGGWAFGTVFMATDPVTAPYTDRARLVYGLLIGVLIVLVRAVNPAYPEGVMLAILFMNMFSPLLDHFVVRANIKRRAGGYER